MEAEGGGMEKVFANDTLASGPTADPSACPRRASATLPTLGMTTAVRLGGRGVRLCVRRGESSDFLQHQRRILGAEADTVADGVLDLGLTADVGNVVEITFRIRNIEIDGRRNLAMLHGD